MRFGCVLLFAISFAFAQQPGETKLSNEQLAVETQANVFYQQHNMVAALPLYEQLTAQFPQNPAYAERLAWCLMSKASNLPDGEEKESLRQRTKTEVERARSLGDRSNAVPILLEWINGKPQTDQNVKMRAAETAFAKGDLDAALASYQDLAADEPQNYQARLYAGDMYFRKHDSKNAAEWFQKAIDVDPNRETAYRYWGDTLMQDGNTQDALQKYIDAIVAEPYNSRSAIGLKQWAQHTGATLRPPSIHLPKGPESKPGPDGKTAINITIDSTSLNKDGAASAWIVYPIGRAAWQGDRFKKEFPNESVYRHSLAEEADALRLVIATARERKIAETDMDDNLRQLIALADGKMIEPFVLLNAADQGIAQDYPAYRAEHRAQLHTYIEKYIVHGPAGKQ